METVLDKFISSGGPLVAFVIVVYFMVKMFLEHMSTQAEFNRQMHREMHNDNLATKKDSKESLDRLSDAVNKNTDATMRLAMLVDKRLT